MGIEPGISSTEIRVLTTELLWLWYIFNNCKRWFQLYQKESFIKRLEKLIRELDKAKIVELFLKERISLSTFYANIKRFENENFFKEGMFTDHPFKFTARMHTHLKKAVTKKRFFSFAWVWLLTKKLKIFKKKKRKKLLAWSCHLDFEILRLFLKISHISKKISKANSRFFSNSNFFAVFFFFKLTQN